MTTAILSSELEKAIAQLHRPELPKILKVQGSIIRFVHEFMSQKGLINVQPLMLSPITDPLNHSVVDATIDYADQKFALTKSMIFHKQILLTSPYLDAIYIVSPNVRLELADRSETGRHLFEFSQVDFEFKNKDREYVLNFMEELVGYVFEKLNQFCKEEILALRGDLIPIPGKFKRYTTGELAAKYGDDFEKKASLEATEPFWLFDHKREFYDKEDPQNLGHYINYDIIWPEGFGEGLSGAERENEYHQILKRMEETNINKDAFKYYLELAKANMIPKTAGAGFGVERMTRYVCKQQNIDSITPFLRKPFAKTIF